jgi:dTDP-4-dehydrorhamnose reductase
MNHFRLAIFGGSSFIGRRLCQHLISILQLATYKNHSFKNGIYFDAISSDAGLLISTHKISHAIIAFAEPDVDKCKRHLEESYNINVLGVKRVIDACVRCNVKIIFLSSEYVFDGLKGQYSETDSPNPTTVYGSQKNQIELYLNKVAPNLHTTLRLSKVYGIGNTDKSILQHWASQIVNNNKILCACDQLFTPVNISFVCDVILRVLQYDITGLYHLSGNTHVSRFDMFNILYKYLPFSVDIEKINLSSLTFEDNRPLNLTMNASKITSATGLSHRNLDEDIYLFSKTITGEK